MPEGILIKTNNLGECGWLTSQVKEKGYRLLTYRLGLYHICFTRTEAFMRFDLLR